VEFGIKQGDFRWLDRATPLAVGEVREPIFHDISVFYGKNFRKI
jgi:hypothetical protein